MINTKGLESLAQKGNEGFDKTFSANYMTKELNLNSSHNNIFTAPSNSPTSLVTCLTNQSQITQTLEIENLQPEDSLDYHLSKLANLIANVTEAYTTAIFVADTKDKVLFCRGLHTLSRNFITDAQISFGSGLIGWTAENAVRISVCPFEHDATTLLCYDKDQDLKSFIAVPILSKRKKILGVIACDSKRSYAFAKVTEKILLDCAEQAAAIIQLHKKVNSIQVQHQEPSENTLSVLFEELRNAGDEQHLLNLAAHLPQEIVQRDALVVMTTSEEGVGKGRFYSSSQEVHIEHRLLELVCKHHKIICSDRSVHALPVNDIKQRSFLSVPLHVLDKEAGSINLLSHPYEAFNAIEIAKVEKIAEIISTKLEHLRLRQSHAKYNTENFLLPWRHFVIQGKNALADADHKRSGSVLIRISFSNLTELENIVGIEAACSAMTKVFRLIEQVVRPPSVACLVLGNDVLILSDPTEGSRLIMRICRLIERLKLDDIDCNIKSSSLNLGQLISSGLQVSEAFYPNDGQNIFELIGASKTSNITANNKIIRKEVANAGRW